jgi:aldose 1-epimerase
MQKSFLSRGRLAAVAVASSAMVAAGAVAAGASDRHRATDVAAAATSITSEPWGSVSGQNVNLYTLKNSHGMTVTITNYGGIVQSIDVPDRHGNVANVALGFPTLAGYVQNNTAPGASGTTYFGAIIGRYANRIANGRFTLNGVTYTLPQNNGTNTLHGGPNAWNTKVWAASATNNSAGAHLTLTYTDPAGTNGFPGTVHATVEYTLTQDNALRITYSATTDAPTVINLTNHSYFNLAGEGSGGVQGQTMMINANSYTPVNANLIPTGVLAPVAGTAFDFRTPKPIGQDINNGDTQLVLAHGFDHNWVLNRTDTGLSLAARATDPASGRVLTTWTTEPGVQFYTGNFLQGDLVGTSGKTYRQTDGFTLETQHFPDSPNQPSFPSTVLNPGTPFHSETVYQFSVTGSGDNNGSPSTHSGDRHKGTRH